MTINVSMTIGGTLFRDTPRINVSKSIGENNSSARFTATFDNQAGLHATDFSVGQTVVIKADKDTEPPTTILFNGTLEDIKFGEKEQRGTVKLSGRDFSARLMDETITPSVFTNQEISTIVTSIVADFTSDITTTNVDVTPVTLNNIRFNHTTVFDAIKQLADLAGFFFFVDNDKDLNFKVKGSSSSGVTLDNTNSISAKFRESDKDLFNEIWVYGGKRLTGYRNDFTADGGSVFTLDYRPHNTEVLVGGSTVPKVGGVFELVDTSDVGSPFQYLVDFDQANIIFVSGTNSGDNIPVSGTDAIIANYKRSVTIVKFASDNASISAFGAREKIIIDKNIDSPAMAKDTAKNTLARHKDPLVQGTVNVQGIIDLTPGDTIITNFPNDNVNNETFDIINVDYTFDPERNESEEVTKVKVSRRIADLTDTIKQMILDIRRLQADDAIGAELLTRLETATGSEGMRIKSWFLRTRDVGSGFILSHLVQGKLGSSLTPQPTLGGSKAAFGLFLSGGDV